MFGHLVKTKNLGNIDEPGVVFETIVSQRLKAFKKMSSPIILKFDIRNKLLGRTRGGGDRERNN